MQTTRCRKVYIVQDAETFEFLCPRDGDVGFTGFFSEAGHFTDAESAYETGADYCHDFKVFAIYLPLQVHLNRD